MKYWAIVISAYLADIAIRVFIQPREWSPDLLLLAILYVTLSAPLGEAYFIALVSGLFWDGAFLDFYGMHSFLFVLAAMLTARLRPLLWVQYAVSRLLLGFLLSALVRFGETIFWLSNMEHPLPLAWPQRYILAGALASGICFMLFPWRSRPISLARKSPQTLFANR